MMPLDPDSSLDILLITERYTVKCNFSLLLSNKCVLGNFKIVDEGDTNAP